MIWRFRRRCTISYLHIPNLYKDQDILLFKECYAMEKIHGSSAHISWNFQRSPNLFLFSGGEKYEQLIKLFSVEKIEQVFKYFNDNMIIFGEVYGGKCQGMKDTYGPDLKFIVFEVKIEDSWLSVPQAEDVANKFGLEFVHYVRIPAIIEEIDKQRDSPSVQAKRNIGREDALREGIVLRPLIEVTKNNGERIIAKHKRDEFKETKSPRTVKDAQEVLEGAEKIADEWVTQMRLEHVLQSMSSKGIEQTGELIKLMKEDVLREGVGEIVESKEMLKAIGKRTASLFKRHLSSKLYK